MGPQDSNSLRELSITGSVPQNRQVDLTDALKKHNDRLLKLELIGQMMVLVRAVQQHRGASIAVLGGNSFFLLKTKSFKTQIDQQLDEIAVAKAFTESISEQRWQDILNSWNTVADQWFNDDVIDNFELHSYLIDLLLELIWNTGLLAEKNLEPDAERYRLTVFALKDLPRMIEILGKIRGLATHAAVAGHCSKQNRIRLECLTKMLHEQNNVLREHVEDFAEELYQQLSSKVALQINEPKFKKLINMVNQDITVAKHTKAAPDEVFSLATKIIDAKIELFNQSLTALRYMMDDKLQAWIQKSSL